MVDGRSAHLYNETGDFAGCADRHERKQSAGCQPVGQQGCWRSIFGEEIPPVRENKYDHC